MNDGSGESLCTGGVTQGVLIDLWQLWQAQSEAPISVREGMGALLSSSVFNRAMRALTLVNGFSKLVSGRSYQSRFAASAICYCYWLDIASIRETGSERQVTVRVGGNKTKRVIR